MSEIPMRIVDENSAIPYRLSPDLEGKVRQALHEDVETISALFKVLSDPVRIRILKALKLCDLCVCVLVEITDYKYPGLSYHLKLLKDAELVDSRREGNFQIYYLTEFGIRTISTVDSLAD